MVEKNEEVPDAAVVKKQILESLDAVNSEDQVKFLVNKLVNIDIETRKARNEAKNYKEQANLVGVLQKKVSGLEKSLSKSEMAKTKLEDLCRQLNQSKKEADRNYQKLRQAEKLEAEKQIESFKTSLSEIQKSVDNRKEQAEQMQNVQNLSESLAKLSAEYERRLADLKVLYEEREESIKVLIKLIAGELNAVN